MVCGVQLRRSIAVFFRENICVLIIQYVSILHTVSALSLWFTPFNKNVTCVTVTSWTYWKKNTASSDLQRNHLIPGYLYWKNTLICILTEHHSESCNMC